MQLDEPFVLVQLALASQTWLSLLHSSISANTIDLQRITDKRKKILASLSHNKAIIIIIIIIIITLRKNRSLKCGLISMGDSLCAKLLVLISVSYSYLPWHNCPSPVYPSLQVQIWEPFVLLQFELTSQTWLPSLHSLTSENKNELPKRYLTETNIKFLSFERKRLFLFVGKFILLFA